MRRDRLAGLVMLAICAVYASQIAAIELDVWAQDSFLTARTLPTVLAIAGGFFALVLVVFPEADSVLAWPSAPQWRRLAGLAAALAAFAPMVQWFGLWLASGLFLMFTQLVEGQRRLVPLLGTSVVTPLMFWALVEKVLQQDVAPGAIFGG